MSNPGGGGRIDQPGSYPEPQPPWPGHAGGTKDQATGPGLQRGLSQSCDPLTLSRPGPRVTTAASPRARTRRRVLRAHACAPRAPAGSCPCGSWESGDVQLCPSRLCVPHCSVCLGRALPSEAAAAVGADPCRGLDLVLPAGADHEPGVGLAPVPRYLAVRGGHLRKGPECPAQGQLRLGVRQGRVAGSPKWGSREGDRLGGLPRAREQPGPGSPGLDLSQRTHWIYRLSWTSLTFLPLLPFTTVIVISAVLLIKGQGTGVGLGHPSCQAPFV